MNPLPTIDDVLSAARQIKPYAIHTPLIESAVLNERVGARVFVKAEIFQRTGSFKFRGAYNAISRLNAADWPGGVVACSSGNHAQGVAEAARLCGLKAVIVMPADAPRLKIARTKGGGAEVVLYDREREDRNAIALALCSEKRAAFVPPFDHPMVMAGQGTTGLEIISQMGAEADQLEAVLVPTSGGGLAAGVGLAVKHHRPQCEVYCVEPEGFNDYGRSLATGAREKNAKPSGSICDALLVGEPGEKTFAVNRGQLSGGLAVSDAEAMQAMAFAFYELKLVLEPGGAVGLAALLSGKYKPRGGAIAVIASGGNVDPALFARAIDA